MKFFANLRTHLKKHAVKYLGGAAVVAGAAQAHLGDAQALLTPKHFALATVGIGMLVPFLDYLKDQGP